MSDNPSTPQTYSPPVPTTAEVDAIAAQLAMLDPNREGIDVTKFRAFYPKLGYGHIERRLAALEAAGRVRRSVRANAGGIMIEYWTTV
jgi:hypothetical protein